MRSNCADCFSASRLRSGLRTPAIISRNPGTHCAAEMPYQRAPNRTGTVAHGLCARGLRTTFAQHLCAAPLRIFSRPYRLYPLGVKPFCRSYPVPHQRGYPVQHQTGGQCCTRGGAVLHQTGGPVQHQRGAKWRERPPRLRTSCGSDPRMQCASRGPVPPSLRGGRSRHSDPCRKARIAEG